MAKVKVNPALLIDQAVRAEVLGRKGVWYQGQERSSAELRKLAGPALFPLPPFNEKAFYDMYKDGSNSSGSR